MKILFTTLILILTFCSNGQLPFKIEDGRLNTQCSNCIKVVEQMPPEVQMGIVIEENGNIYFSMNNKEYFNKIFLNEKYGICADIISKEKYDCNKNNSISMLPLGTFSKPIYLTELLKRNTSNTDDNVYINIGNIPESLKRKEIEGNLVILNDKKICNYIPFIDIERTELSLLPMGLFTDSLLQNSNNSDTSKNDFFTYSKNLQVEVIFPKSSATLSQAFVKKIYDSLQLNTYRIRQVEIRSYASVEGSEIINLSLMKQRANTMLAELKKYEPLLTRIKVITAENWLDFYEDINNTKYSEFKTLSKQEVKQKLEDKKLNAELEQYFSKERKAILTFYLQEKTKVSTVQNNQIVNDFNKAIAQNDIAKAKELQKELAERIIDNKLPSTYIEKLEVPKTKEFAVLANDNLTFKLLLRLSSEAEALANYEKLKLLDPSNGKIKYNICALKLFMWNNGDNKLNQKKLLDEIISLEKQKINTNLVNRMLINFYILKSANDMALFKYDDKDVSLSVIRGLYKKIKMTDEEIFSLSKYYTNYSQQQWSEEIIAPRLGKINCSEDLIFYYLNLKFYDQNSFKTPSFQTALINAININKKRYCNFFLPIQKGGASFQLLQHNILKNTYCENCK